MKILLIGSKHTLEQFYYWLSIADMQFEIEGIVSVDDRNPERYLCPVYSIVELEQALACDYDAIFISREYYDKVSDIIVRLGGSPERLLVENIICSFLSKVDVMRYYEEYVREEHQKKYQTEKTSVGVFSYGIPHITYFGNDSNLYIGKYCSIARNVTIMLGGDHQPQWCTTYPFNDMFTGMFPEIENNPSSKGDVVIGNDVWIADGAKIMSGVTIGNGAVICANALVNKDVAPYTMVAGIPAKPTRKRFSDEIIEKLQEIKWWDWDYEDVYDAIPILQSEQMERLFQYYEEKVRAIQK